MQTVENIALNEIKRFPYAVCSLVEGHPGTLVVTATATYIPKTQFQEIFISMVPTIVAEDITTLVFDQRKLTVYNQASMDWYFLVWKEAMHHRGLTKHRTLLPTDPFFRESVNIGLKKIDRMNPEGKYKELDLRECDSLEEAITE